MHDEHFTEEKSRIRVCISRLMSTELIDMLGENSKLVRFGKRFVKFPVLCQDDLFLSFTFANPFNTNIKNIKQLERYKFMLWENLRSDEFPAAIEKSGGLCVIVLGCLEKHGPHLPVGTDSLKGDGIAKIACEKTDVMMFPTTMWLGDVSGARQADPTKRGLYGFVAINPETLLNVLEELCDEIARNGFKKILLLSSHGGNIPFLSYFVRCQSFKRKDYATMWMRCYDFASITPKNVLNAAKEKPEEFTMLTEEDYRTLEYRETLDDKYGGHADFRETGLVYGTTPELVAPERFELEDGLSTKVADYLFEHEIDHPHAWGYSHPDSYAGLPSTGCTETIGKAMVKISVDRLVKALEMLKKDERCVKFADGTFKFE